jgi:hypothetical protein
MFVNIHVMLNTLFQVCGMSTCILLSWVTWNGLCFDPFQAETERAIREDGQPRYYALFCSYSWCHRTFICIYFITLQVWSIWIGAMAYKCLVDFFVV